MSSAVIASTLPPTTTLPPVAAVKPEAARVGGFTVIKDTIKPLGWVGQINTDGKQGKLKQLDDNGKSLEQGKLLGLHLYSAQVQGAPDHGQGKPATTTLYWLRDQDTGKDYPLVSTDKGNTTRPLVFKNDLEAIRRAETMIQAGAVTSALDARTKPGELNGSPVIASTTLPVKGKDIPIILNSLSDPDQGWVGVPGKGQLVVRSGLDGDGKRHYFMEGKPKDGVTPRWPIYPKNGQPPIKNLEAAKERAREYLEHWKGDSDSPNSKLYPLTFEPSWQEGACSWLAASPLGGLVGRFEKPANGVSFDKGQPGIDVYFASKRFPAVLDGTVTRVGYEGNGGRGASGRGYGNFLVVRSRCPQTGGPVDVLYAHLNKIYVKEGAQVKAGQILGQQGNTGRVLNADSIASIDFLAPADPNSNSMRPFTNSDRLRRYIANQLMSGGGLLQAACSATSRVTADLDAGGDVLSMRQILQLALKAGFPREHAIIMGAIAMAESQGKKRAHNPDASTGDDSFGIWQINMLGDLLRPRLAQFGLKDKWELLNPTVNARAARIVYKEARGFRPWSTYREGLHLPYMAQARAVMAALFPSRGDGISMK
jgi:hypothetical protein